MVVFATVTLSPGAHVGPYEILGLLGAGGMGEVYRARLRQADSLSALAEAHGKGITHRDLKPGNTASTAERGSTMPVIRSPSR